jgi:hypothetical protein
MNNSIKLMPDEAPAAGVVVEEEPIVPQTGIDPNHEKGLATDGGVKPTVPDDEKVVSFDAFKTGEPKVEEKPKDEPVQPDKAPIQDKDTSADKKDATEIKPDVKPTEVKPDGSSKGTEKTTKDISYEGFSEAQVRFLKNSSREAREYFASQIKENNERAAKIKEINTQFEEFKKTGNAGLPQSYLEHQDAYVLNKDFQKEVETVQKASSELGFWENQLVRIKSAEKWTDYVNQGGKLVAVEREPGPEAEILVGNRIKRVEQVIQAAETKANSIKAGHIEIHKQNIATIKQVEDEQYPQFKDEEKCAGKEHIKYMRDVLSQLGQGSNVLSGAFAKMFASQKMVGAYIKQLEEENKKLKGGAITKREVGPTSDDISGADRHSKPTNKEDEVVPFSSFNRESAV